MKVVQMTLDEKLISEVDKIVKETGTTRSAFARRALRREIEHIKNLALEKKHIEGYEKYPGQPGEFDIWENEQNWID